MINVNFILLLIRHFKKPVSLEEVGEKTRKYIFSVIAI